MDWQAFTHEVIDITKDAAMEMELVTWEPDRFMSEFYTRIHKPRKQDAPSRGGLKRLGTRIVPYVGIALGARATDGEVYKQYLSNLNGGKTSWNRAILLAKQGHWYHVEYFRIQDKPGIGGFVSEDARHHLIATVCHEVAHAIDYWNGTRSNHGVPWQETYFHLREALLNEHLPDQPFTVEELKEIDREHRRNNAKRKRTRIEDYLNFDMAAEDNA